MRKLAFKFTSFVDAIFDKIDKSPFITLLLTIILILIFKK